MQKNLLLLKIFNYLLLLRYDRLLPFINFSFSQEGEDVILRRLFENKKKGFYVDIGAHHPIRFSNTFHFYRIGWKGINIDACPGIMRLFGSLRPNDINIEAAIGKDPTHMEYFMFDDPALNSFDRDLSLERDRNTTYRILEKKLIRIVPLKDILEQYLPTGENIDFLNIDVEGLELDVLRSNDWNNYSPKVILVEYFSNSLNEIFKSEIHDYLSSHRYHLISSTPHTLFYQLEHSVL